MREEVQASSGCESADGSTSPGSALIGALGGKGYGKVHSRDRATADMELTRPLQNVASDAADEILGVPPHSSPSRTHENTRSSATPAVVLQFRF